MRQASFRQCRQQRLVKRLRCLDLGRVAKFREFDEPGIGNHPDSAAREPRIVPQSRSDIRGSSVWSQVRCDRRRRLAITRSPRGGIESPTGGFPSSGRSSQLPWRPNRISVRATLAKPAMPLFDLRQDDATLDPLAPFKVLTASCKTNSTGGSSSITACGCYEIPRLANAYLE
jgi:hypothetical protein